MAILSRKIFRELAEVRQQYCVSIYIPTERSGENKKAQIRFKNKILQVRDALSDFGMPGKHIPDFIEPLEMLLNDSGVWRHMSDGLAVFLSPGKFAYSSFPIRFQDHATVNKHFYLLPLMPLFNGDGRFFLLALSLNAVSLFEGTRDHIAEIEIQHLVPQRMEDTIGTDYEPKSLQFRSGQTAGGQGLYHGQGRGKDFKKEEIEKHLRAVDKNLMDVINDNDVPLIVACVDYIFPIYRKVNSYPGLFHKNIPGNPEETHMQDLHPKAWALVEDLFRKHRTEAARQFHFLAGKERTVTHIADIAEAAVNGRIDTLLIEKGLQIRGIADNMESGVLVQKENTKNNYCLVDFAAKNSFLNGAKVFLLDKEEMPDPDVRIGATLRY